MHQSVVRLLDPVASAAAVWVVAWAWAVLANRAAVVRVRRVASVPVGRAAWANRRQPALVLLAVYPVPLAASVRVPLVALDRVPQAVSGRVARVVWKRNRTSSTTC